jgi:hypothetical protein
MKDVVKVDIDLAVYQNYSDKNFMNKKSPYLSGLKFNLSVI